MGRELPHILKTNMALEGAIKAIQENFDALAGRQETQRYEMGSLASAIGDAGDDSPPEINYEDFSLELPGLRIVDSESDLATLVAKDGDSAYVQGLTGLYKYMEIQPTVTTYGDRGITAPTGLTATETTGGVLTAATYGYKVTAYNAYNADNESLPSTEVTVVVTGGNAGSTAAVDLDWIAVTGAVGYRVYGRTSGGPWGQIADVSDPTITFLDTGSVTPGGDPPDSNVPVNTPTPPVSGTTNWFRSIDAADFLADSITATHLSVETLSAISANLGTVTAGAITGVTVTGGVIRTAVSGGRVEITSTNDRRISFYNTAGTLVGYVVGDPDGGGLDAAVKATEGPLRLLASAASDSGTAVLVPGSGLRIGTFSGGPDNALLIRNVTDVATIPTPPSGFVSIFYNSADRRIQAKNFAGTVRKLNEVDF